MNKYDANFAGYATRVAFDIRLTRHQIFWFCAFITYVDSKQNRVDLAEHRYAHGMSTDLFVPAGKALCARGLLAHDGDKTWSITDAGRHVFALLQIAGLAVDFGQVANEAA